MLKQQNMNYDSQSNGFLPDTPYIYIFSIVTNLIFEANGNNENYKLVIKLLCESLALNEIQLNSFLWISDHVDTIGKVGKREILMETGAIEEIVNLDVDFMDPQSCATMQKMEPAFINVRDIAAVSKNIALLVKVVRMWVQKGYGYDKNNFINELILVDEQGDKIGLLIRSQLRAKFVRQFSEDGTYIIRNVSVADNKLWKTIHCDHEYKLSCVFKTFVTKTSEWNGQPTRFNFRQFSDILNLEIGYDVSVDVIGRMVGIGNLTPYVRDGLDTKYINATIKDISGDVLYCTLWGDFADKLNDYMDVKQPGVGVILIIQFGKTKERLCENTVNTDWKCTEVYLNSDDPVTNEFRTRYIEAHGDDDVLVTVAPTPTVSSKT
ncbi:replication protein A 70 kDa DNA-binding subunit C-like [Rutidosis leptorrhynchoides]|uniref:replication protein A 70 kDa DNA-binding subunit C-like n=1 Tax=Rutidosis leptorrhynchoides TaxID=125765 RepID=UPI003A99709A